jgi:Carboxypeptidase regulatory-like domain
MRRRIAFAFLFSAWLVLYSSISPQQIKSRAPISVVVTDPTGAPIPHAEVKIVSAPSLGLPTQQLETNESGVLAVELQPGEYDITVHALSFRTVSRHIIAQNSVAQSVGFLLQVGGCPPGCDVVPMSAAPTITSDLANVVTAKESAASDAESNREHMHYSNCPDLEHAVLRSVGYIQATETELRKWAKVKISPRMTSHPEMVHVQVQVEGERVFCAQANDGPSDKQKAAVDAAMQWKFRKKRGEFKNDLMGTLTFQF